MLTDERTDFLSPRDASKRERKKEITCSGATATFFLKAENALYPAVSGDAIASNSGSAEQKKNVNQSSSGTHYKYASPVAHSVACLYVGSRASALKPVATER